MTNQDIAMRICSHLKRFSADPAIAKLPDGRTAYWNPVAFASGRWIYVQYVSYQGSSNLTKFEAEQYLAWLDASNVGKHHEALESVTKGEK